MLLDPSGSAHLDPCGQLVSSLGHSQLPHYCDFGAPRLVGSSISVPTSAVSLFAWPSCDSALPNHPPRLNWLSLIRSSYCPNWMSPILLLSGPSPHLDASRSMLQVASLHNRFWQEAISPQGTRIEYTFFLMVWKET